MVVVVIVVVVLLKFIFEKRFHSVDFLKKKKKSESIMIIWMPSFCLFWKYLIYSVMFFSKRSIAQSHSIGSRSWVVFIQAPPSSPIPSFTYSLSDVFSFVVVFVVNLSLLSTLALLTPGIISLAKWNVIK